ncbi:MAG: ATP-binding protein [Armatimonadetes bacterium]|nr:ATP-binding protein [Armatimonadota bacterium]
MSDELRAGLVDGVTEGTTGQFRVLLDEDRYLQLDELVATRQVLPTGVVHTTYGIVSEVYGKLEGAAYASDTARIARDQTMPGYPVRTADVRVLRTLPEIWVPPAPGAVVERAAQAHRRNALYLDQMERPLPVALDNTGEPIYLDFDFLDGTRGGHASISGVSGVATKTSFALHLLYVLLETSQGREALGKYASGTRALVFNVKGEDLLHFDKPSSAYERRCQQPELPEQWRKLGVDRPGPFHSVRFFAPVSRHAGDSLGTDVESRPADQITPYGWTPLDFIRRGLLRFCFSDVDDSRNQLSFIEQRVRVQLARWAHPLEGAPGAAVMIPPAQGTGYNLEKLAQEKREPRSAMEGEVIRSFRDLVDFLELQLENEGGAREWTGGTQAGTVNAFLRRLHAMVPRFGHLVTHRVRSLELQGEGAPTENVIVVDINSLHEDGQRFVVGSLLSSIFEAKERGRRFPLHFIVLDELNKYAPRQGSSPLKEVLVDIAARGRSLGVILIGAQQSASDVEGAITRNAAIRVVGRLDGAESTADIYRFLTPEVRERATRLLPGAMILDQPIIPAPIPFRFPFPNYATRADEIPQMTEVEMEQAFLFR